MKTNGRIRQLLATPCLNDIEYGHRVIWPLLDYLGVPPEARRPELRREYLEMLGLWPLPERTPLNAKNFGVAVGAHAIYDVLVGVIFNSGQ